MVPLCSAVCQAYNGPASLLFSCRCWPVGRERLWWWLHPLPVTQQYHLASMATWLSSLISPQSVSSLSHPLNPSLCSQLQPSPWDCPTIPKLQHPAAAPSRGPVFLPRVCMASARTVWFSLHLGCHRSAVSLSALNVSPLTQTIARIWRLDPCLSSPTCRGLVQSF